MPRILRQPSSTIQQNGTPKRAETLPSSSSSVHAPKNEGGGTSVLSFFDTSVFAFVTSSPVGRLQMTCHFPAWNPCNDRTPPSPCVSQRFAEGERRFFPVVSFSSVITGSQYYCVHFLLCRPEFTELAWQTLGWLRSPRWRSASFFVSHHGAVGGGGRYPPERNGGKRREKKVKKR